MFLKSDLRNPGEQGYFQQNAIKHSLHPTLEGFCCFFSILPPGSKNVQWEYCILFLACWDSLSACVGVNTKENEQMLGHINSLTTRQVHAPRSSFCNKADLLSECFLSFVSRSNATGRKSGMCALPLEQAVYEEFFWRIYSTLLNYLQRCFLSQYEFGLQWVRVRKACLEQC